MYEKILARNFGKIDQKQLRVWAFLSIFLFALSLCTILKPYMSPLPILNLPWTKGINLKMLYFMDTADDQRATHQTAQVIQPKKFEPVLIPICNFTGEKSDFCDINGDIRIQGNASSIFFTSPRLTSIPENSSWAIKPYARKTDATAMGNVKQLSLKPAHSNQELPQCTVKHSIPAVVFSTGGYAGNFFHDFSDVIIPLYLTTLPFKGEVQLLVQDKQSWWMNKFDLLLKSLTNYDIIDLDNDRETRCFKTGVIGLKSHKDFGIDPEKPPFGHSLRNFTQFLRRTYSLKRKSAIRLRPKDSRKPRLLIISRMKTRVLLNEDELAAEARGLGFDVESIDAGSKLKDFSKFINSFDVMVGVHGAGLTNMIFLPENAVLIQVVPVALESICHIFYERPARNMNLKYLEYKISQKESTLVDQYPVDHLVFTDPASFQKEGWERFKSIYLDKQDVRLDVSRFRTVLLEAMQLLH